MPPLAEQMPSGLLAFKRKKTVEDPMVVWILESKRAVKTAEHARETIRNMREDKYRGLLVEVARGLVG